MQHTEGYFKGVRDANIYYQAWLPEADAEAVTPLAVTPLAVPPLAVLLVVHGLGEHSGRYMNVVNHFAPLGYAVYALDHLGHGKSEGKREIVARFEDFTDTLEIFYKMVTGWQPGKPVFLIGHSMGGLIAVAYLIDHQADFKGAVISAPAIVVGASITPVVIAMSKFLSKVAPGMGMLALDVNTISHDPQVVSAYAHDPLVFHGKTPARLAGEMLRTMLRVEPEMGKISLPLFVVQGSDDRLVDPRGAQMLYDRASSADKSIKIYQGYYHEVFNEPEHEQVLGDVEAWLGKHI
jgi:alpha-beta hydrolase superfamily lysophospholipase